MHNLQATTVKVAQDDVPQHSNWLVVFKTIQRPSFFTKKEDTGPQLSHYLFPTVQVLWAGFERPSVR